MEIVGLVVEVHMPGNLVARNRIHEMNSNGASWTVLHTKSNMWF
jgi:hypothetical protein